MRLVPIKGNESYVHRQMKSEPLGEQVHQYAKDITRVFQAIT